MRRTASSWVLMTFGVCIGVVLIVSGRLTQTARAQQRPVPLSVATADTDVNQLATGTVTGNSMVMVQGPFVLTDLMPPSGQGFFLVEIGAGTTCPVTPALSIPLFNTGAINFHGARILVPAGSVACGSTSNGPSQWAGYRPY